MRLPLFAKTHGNSVRGVHFEEMVDAAREGRAVKAVAQELGNQNIRRALDVVAGAGVAFDAHAQLAQLLNPAPHLLARDADFFGDLCAADDDSGILGQERKQAVDAPVGGAGKIGQSFCCHRE